MKKVLFIILLLIPIYVMGRAINPLCNQEAKLNLRKTTSNFSYALEKYKDTDTIFYKVTILNMDNNIVVNYLDNKYSSTNNEILKIVPGTTLNLKLDAKENTTCDGYSIGTKTISIPYYNKFKDNELCTDNEEYFLCKEDINTKVSEEEFNRQIKEYIKNKNKPLEKENEEISITKDNSMFENILDFVYKNYIYILFGVIALGVIGIAIILIKKHTSEEIL